MDPILGKKGVGHVVMAKGVLTCLLGMLHVIAAFTFEATDIAGTGSAKLCRDYLVWFGGVGVFVLFLGLLDLACWRPLQQGNPLAMRIATLDAATTGLFGSAGIYLFGISPPFTLCLAALGWIPLALLRWPHRIPHPSQSASPTFPQRTP